MKPDLRPPNYSHGDLENSKLKLQFIELRTPKQTKSPQNWRVSKKPLRHITNNYTYNQTRQTGQQFKLS